MRPKSTRWSPRTPITGVLVAIVMSLNLGMIPKAQSAEKAPVPLTLDEALQEAHRANRELPLARFDLSAAQARAKQARGGLYPSFSLEGDIHDGTPQRYASGDALLAVFARVPLYAGGALRAERARTEALVDARGAGYRMAVRDVNFEVRVDFARIVRAETTLEFRRHAVARLRAYLSQVESRLAAGQGIAAEALLAKQRLASARGDTATVIRDLDEARLNFNDLLGREPSAPLALAPLPEPTPPPEYDEEAWRSAPDLQQAGAEVRAAQSELDATRAGRRPHLELEANAGAEPVLGTFDAPLNTGRDWGSEITLWFHLPLWDRGVHAGRMQEADAALQQAKQREIVVRHSADLAWSKAISNLRNLYAELQARDEAVSVARDAYLQAESLYRGGQSRALEVLDAYDGWIQAGQDRLDVIYAYRLAQAELQRWGKP